MLFMVGLGIYYQLGGFNEVEYTIEPRDGIKLMGRTYRGTPQDEQLGNTFKEIEALIQKNPGSNLHTLYYSEPAGKLDTLLVFVGVEYQDHMDRLKYNLELKTIPCTQVIVANIKAHRLVMTGPDQVKRGIEKFARKNEVVTQGIFVDRIKGEGEVEVIAPIQPGNLK